MNLKNGAIHQKKGVIAQCFKGQKKTSGILQECLGRVSSITQLQTYRPSRMDMLLRQSHHALYPPTPCLVQNGPCFWHGGGVLCVDVGFSVFSKFRKIRRLDFWISGFLDSWIPGLHEGDHNSNNNSNTNNNGKTHEMHVRRQAFPAQVVLA